MTLFDPVKASYTGWMLATNCLSMMMWLILCSVDCKDGLVGMMISCVRILSASRMVFSAALVAKNMSSLVDSS